MRNCLLIIILAHFSIRAYTQKIIPEWELEAGNCDSLKRLLPELRGIKRIDLLNELSFSYFMINRDSALVFAKQAFVEAYTGKYRNGMAISLAYQSQVEPDLKKAIAINCLALDEAQKAGNIRCIAIVQITMAFQHYSRRKYDDALAILQKAESYCNQVKDEKVLAQVYHVRSMIYYSMKRTYDGFKMATTAAALFRKTGGHLGYADALSVIGRVYRGIGEFPAAISYFRMSNEHRVKHHFFAYWRNYNEIGHIHSEQKNFDSALYAYELAVSAINAVIKDSVAKTRATMEVLGNKSEVFLKMMNHDSALKVSAQLLAYNRKERNSSEIMKGLRRMGKAYMIQQHFGKALQYGKESLQFALANGSHQGVKDGAALLSELYDKLDQPDSAWFYYKLSNTGNDSTVINSLNNNLTFYKAMKQNEADGARIQSLRRENNLKQERLNFLLISILSLLLLGFFFFRNSVLRRKNEAQKHELLKNTLQLQQLESEKKYLEFQQQAATLEMQALRAQMNPHFIFNSLNAINCFVLKSETETASDYLTRFARLVRSVLQHSLQNVIPLSEELATLQLYIELEQLRFKQHFTFNINVSDDVESDAWMIPPMLLQPFVENAIWHGLMHREEAGGNLTIDVETSGQMLSFTVTDNGVGRPQSTIANRNGAAGRKSLGLEMTANRLKILNPGLTKDNFLEITDLKTTSNKPAGTRVTIKIPVVT